MVHRPRALPKSTSIRDPEVRASRLLISGSAVGAPVPFGLSGNGPEGRFLTSD